MEQNKKAEIESWVTGEALDKGVYEPFDESFYTRFFSMTFLPHLPPAGQRVLDVGCATGAMSKRLARLGYQVTGVDISPQLLEIADRLAKTEGIPVEYKVADGERTPFPDNSFDAVLAFNLLHHFPKIDGVAQELVRVCKPGGYIFTFDPNYCNPHAFLCQEHLSPVRYDRLTENERAIRPGEFAAFGQKQIEVKFLYSELKSSSKSRLYHKLYGFIARSIKSPAKRLLAFFLFNIAHLITPCLPEKFRGSTLLGIIRKDGGAA